MANIIRIMPYGNCLKLIFDDSSTAIAYPTVGDMFITKDADPAKILKYGDDFKLLFNDGSTGFAYFTNTYWIAIGSGGVVPPTGGLIDPWIDVWGISAGGDWEGHASYSQGGTDYPLNMRTPLVAVAAGTLVDNGWTDSGGKRTTLHFDEIFPRKIAPSPTVMSGGYVETNEDIAALCYQHQDEVGAEGHYEQGEVLGYSGNTASPPDGTGDIHLHVHGYGNVTGGRVDFRKFFD